MEARGASPNDRLCVFDYSQQPVRLGCVDPVEAVPTPVVMQSLPDWRPQVQVSGISSTTVVVTVTNVAETALSVQLLPALGVASNEVAMTKIGNVFTRTVSATDGAYYGFVRIFVPNSNPNKELIVEFNTFEDWGGKVRFWATPTDAWGGKVRFWAAPAYSWGGKVRFWAAPVMSSDGQVSIFALDNPYANTQRVTLQTVAFPSSLPAWLTPVGQAYQLTSNTAITSSAILFSYLSRDVPDGYENTLQIFYQPTGQTIWQPLPTELDTYRNVASTQISGQGTYLLIATLQVHPQLVQGWNNIGYSIQATQTITSALESIQGSYSIIHHYNPLLVQPWQSFDPSVPISFSADVNSLTMLEPNHAYWIHATQPVTLYLDVTPVLALEQLHFVDASAATPSAPAIYYGWLSSTSTFTPKVGMSVSAMIDDRICGETTVHDFAGQLGYMLRVLAHDEGSNQGCGEPGKEFVLSIDHNAMTQTIAWDNSRTQQIDLNSSIIDTSQSLYLPLINR